jgi:hypothetical protein
VALSTLGNIQATLENIQSALDSNQFWSLHLWAPDVEKMRNADGFNNLIYF